MIFSAVFFLVTAVRRLNDLRRNELAKRENLRKTVFEAIYQDPSYVLPGSIVPSGSKNTPKGWEDQRQKEIDRYAAHGEADIEQEEGKQYYVFEELSRVKKDLETLRKGIDPSQFGAGNVVFDSGDPSGDTSDG